MTWRSSADYVNNRGRNLIRRIDTNAPASVRAGVSRSVAAADATRPIVPAAGGFRLIEQDESTGRSQFHGLYLNARQRVSRRFAFDVAYTLSRIENDTDDINFRPVDSRRPERGARARAQRSPARARAQRARAAPARDRPDADPVPLERPAAQRDDRRRRQRRHHLQRSAAGFSRNSERTAATRSSISGWSGA